MANYHVQSVNVKNDNKSDSVSVTIHIAEHGLELSLKLSDKGVEYQHTRNPDSAKYREKEKSPHVAVTWEEFFKIFRNLEKGTGSTKD